MKIIQRIQGAKGSRIQVKNLEVKTLESLNPIFELKRAMTWIHIFKDPSKRRNRVEYRF